MKTLLNRHYMKRSREYLLWVERGAVRACGVLLAHGIVRCKIAPKPRGQGCRPAPPFRQAQYRPRLRIW